MVAGAGVETLDHGRGGGRVGANRATLNRGRERWVLNPTPWAWAPGAKLETLVVSARRETLNRGRERWALNRGCKRWALNRKPWS